MQSIQSWATGLCAAALVCAVLRLIAPDAGSGKVFRLLLGAFFLSACLAPFGWDWSWQWPSLSLDPSDTPQQLTQQVTEQLAQQVRERVRQVTEQALTARGITADKITVSVDIGQDGSIYIDWVQVTLPRQHQGRIVAVRQELTQLLQAEVSVDIEKG